MTAPPAYKPEDHPESGYPPIFTIATADPLNGRNTGNKDFVELPPTYEEAIVISQNESLSRRE